jgi:hypothetical protein
VASSIALAVIATAAPAENEPASSIDEYLQRVGYLPVMLKRGEQDKHLAEGVLAGKKRLFLVDTGWGRTSLNENAARGLKTLGELDITLEDSFMGKLSDPSIVLMDKLSLDRAQFFNQPAIRRRARLRLSLPQLLPHRLLHQAALCPWGQTLGRGNLRH